MSTQTTVLITYHLLVPTSTTTTPSLDYFVTYLPVPLYSLTFNHWTPLGRTSLSLTDYLIPSPTHSHPHTNTPTVGKMSWQGKPTTTPIQLNST